MEAPGSSWRQDLVKQIPIALRLWTKMGFTSVRRKYLCPIQLRTEDIDASTQDRIELTLLLGDAIEEKVREPIELEVRKYGLAEDITNIAIRALSLVARANFEERCFADLENDSRVAAHCQVMLGLRLSNYWGAFISKIAIQPSNSYRDEDYAIRLDPRHTNDPSDRYDSAERGTISDLINKFLFVSNQELETLTIERGFTRKNTFIESLQYSLPVSRDIEQTQRSIRAISEHPEIRYVDIPEYEERVLKVHRKKFKVIHNYAYGYYERTGESFKDLVLNWLEGQATTENRAIWLRADPTRLTDERLTICSSIAFQLSNIIAPLQWSYLIRRIDINATPQASECLKALLKLSVATFEDAVGYTLYSDTTVNEDVLLAVNSALISAKEKYEEAESVLSFSGIRESKWKELNDKLLDVADSRQLINLTFNFFPGIKVDWRYTALIEAIFKAAKDTLLKAEAGDESTLLKAYLDPPQGLSPIDINALTGIHRDSEGKLRLER